MRTWFDGEWHVLPTVCFFPHATSIVASVSWFDYPVGRWKLHRLYYSWQLRFLAVQLHQNSASIDLFEIGAPVVGYGWWWWSWWWWSLLLYTILLVVLLLLSLLLLVLSLWLSGLFVGSVCSDWRWLWGPHQISFQRLSLFKRPGVKPCPRYQKGGFPTFDTMAFCWLDILLKTEHPWIWTHNDVQGFIWTQLYVARMNRCILIEHTAPFHSLPFGLIWNPGNVWQAENHRLSLTGFQTTEFWRADVGILFLGWEPLPPSLSHVSSCQRAARDGVGDDLLIGYSQPLRSFLGTNGTRDSETPGAWHVSLAIHAHQP